MDRNELTLACLSVTVHRTVRVEMDGLSSLPPTLGPAVLYRVSNFKGNCPPGWAEEAYFTPLHAEEAIWLSFLTASQQTPCAVMVGAGGVNAVNGKPWEAKLAHQGYMVTPPQPWLDGWKGGDGSVYQFVATEYGGGEGKTVGEQILGKESKSGGIDIAVFEAKEPEKLAPVRKPITLAGWNDENAPTKPHFAFACCRSAGGGSSFGEMGVGKGGKIEQKIYPDPHGIEVWNEKPSAANTIYLVNGAQFAEITGLEMHPLPVSAKTYHGHWYSLKDEVLEDVDGTDKFDNLKPAAD